MKGRRIRSEEERFIKRKDKKGEAETKCLGSFVRFFMKNHEKEPVTLCFGHFLRFFHEFSWKIGRNSFVSAISHEFFMNFHEKEAVTLCFGHFLRFFYEFSWKRNRYGISYRYIYIFPFPFFCLSFLFILLFPSPPLMSNISPMSTMCDIGNIDRQRVTIWKDVQIR